MRLVRLQVVIAAAFLASGVAAASAGASLAVMPFPGTPDASPRTQVIFSSLSPGELRSVSVGGSLSGPHAGRLSALPDGAGTAFVPARRFSPGERVHVSALLRSGARIGFSFTVARPPPGRPVAPAADTARPAAGPPSQHVRSAPHVRPPMIEATPGRTAGSPDSFLAPVHASQAGPLVLDSQGKTVWFHPLTGEVAEDLNVQSYRGHPVLTWWQGVGLTRGVDVIVNSHYRRVAAVRAGNGYMADAHEFQITPQGTALIDAYVPARADLTSVGGPADGTVLDGVVQEVDIRTGRVLWEWHALGHIPLTQSHVGPSGFYYDAYHLNSIQQLPSGNLLISVRNTWGVYEISRRTGRVIWTLGGRDSSFRMGHGTNFEWQHDARMHPDGTLSLFDDAFDDAGKPQAERQSSAKFLRLDTRTMTATLKKRFTHSPPLLSSASGNSQLLPNHDVFVGWGSQGQFSEYIPAGRQIFTGSFPLGVYSYRAYRYPWVGRPLTRPLLALSRTSHGAVKLYASWNGATQVAAWRLLGGSRRRQLRQLGATASRTGFETVVRRHTSARFFAAQALDSRGRPLATSAVHTLDG